MLRPDLKWHDGQPVTAADCVASIRRWASRDSMGQTLTRFTASLEATDANTIKLVLKEPYGLVLDSLAKIGAPVPFMMPERIAKTPGAPALVFGADGLRGVLDHKELVPLSHLHHRIHVGHLAVKMHRDDRARSRGDL